MTTPTALDSARRALRDELASCFYLARRAHPDETIVHIDTAATRATVHLGPLSSLRSAESAEGTDLADALTKLTAKLTRRVARVEAQVSL